MLPIRFGEAYELRFQREDTKRQFREHPYTQTHVIFENKPENVNRSLAAYLKTNNLAGKIFYDDAYAVFFNEKRPDRWVLLTDGPNDNTLSKYNSVWDSMSDSKKPQFEYNLELVTGYKKAGMFPRKLPKVVIRYRKENLTPEEKDAFSMTYNTNNGKSILAKTQFIWTNQDEVLKQIQVEKIAKLDVIS